MPWKIFAEDAGTGLSSQDDRDWGDGANFNAQSHDQNSSDYRVASGSISVTYSTPEATINQGQYRIKAQNVDTRTRNNTTITWPEVTFVVNAPQKTVSLTDNDTNHIFIDLTISGTTGDKGSYTVNTTGNVPSSPSLKIAEIDTSSDTLTRFNENPDHDSADTAVDKLATNNQTWSDNLSGSRSFGTWETAPSDEDIRVKVMVDAGSTSSSQKIALDVNTSQNGNIVDRINWAGGANSAQDQLSVGAKVPAGHNYRVRQENGSASTIINWRELST